MAFVANCVAEAALPERLDLRRAVLVLSWSGRAGEGIDP